MLDERNPKYRCKSLRILRIEKKITFDGKLLFVNAKVMSKNETLSSLLITISKKTAFHLVENLGKQLNKIEDIENGTKNIN